MRIQTLSIITGSTACNARCPFCVSKMTHTGDMNAKPNKPNWRNFGVAMKLAKESGVTTVMLTGKGEPTLWINLIDLYLNKIDGKFPLIELQTNGLAIHDMSDETLQRWYEQGMTTIAISVSHWADNENQHIYCPHKKEYPPLVNLINRLHSIGFSVRLNCIMSNNRIGNLDQVLGFISFAKDNLVEQVTLMPVNFPSSVSENNPAYHWVKYNKPKAEAIEEIVKHLFDNGTLLMKLAHNALVFDYKGQNVCLSSCLKNEEIEDKTTMRNLIFFPDGHLRYDWEHPGAILI